MREPEVPNGRDIYLGHCAVCHGLDGRGQGPLAQAMKLVPADLTQIASRHDGSFPDPKVADVIRNGGSAMARGQCYPGVFTSANGINQRWARRASKRWLAISSHCRKRRSRDSFGAYRLFDHSALFLNQAVAENTLALEDLSLRHSD